MGIKIIDKYSLLHYAWGIIINYWGIALIPFIAFHILFEIFENSKIGIMFIDEFITFWPGGKKRRDTILNMMSDTLFATFGWITANYVNTRY